MDPFKYTFIGHLGLDHCNPISAAKIEQIIDLLDLPPGGRAADVGCGKAELLIRLIERCGIRAIGVDRSPRMIAEARCRATARLAPGCLELHEMDAATFKPEPGSFDFAACLGATEIHGGLASSLRTLGAWVRPGGFVLVGEGFWQRGPAPELLAALHAKPGDYLDHSGNVAAGVAAGLTPMYATVGSQDDWDRYEWLLGRQVELYALENPADPDVPALLARRRAWRDLYLKWGRDTLGFGLYLFRR